MNLEEALQFGEPKLIENDGWKFACIEYEGLKYDWVISCPNQEGFSSINVYNENDELLDDICVINTRFYNMVLRINAALSM